jgi:acetyl-CoA/propionyl-CoA carboxylase biotin carboxyl carrier protein
LGEETINVSLSGPVAAGTASLEGTDALPVSARIEGDQILVELGGRLRRITFARDGDRVWLSHEGHSWELVRQRETIGHAGPSTAGQGPVNSPMPGTVLAVHVEPGQIVVEGQALVTVEAMKMEHVVSAQTDGTVSSVLVAPGDPVALGQTLAEVSSGGPS